MPDQNKDQNQQNMNQNPQQGGVKKTGVGQQPAQPQKGTGTGTAQPINNPNIRK